jgi:N-alpha-acetyltransferase 35, NatC auxiliary subunit
MGHPLSQTIFTSLYIDRLLNSKSTVLEDICFVNATTEPISLKVLRAYCLGLLMACSRVNNRVKSEHFYEVTSEGFESIIPKGTDRRFQEEDFVTHTYNRNLLEDIDDSAIIACLREAQAALSSAEMASSELKDALSMRLKFRIGFLTTISLADQRDMTLSKQAWDDLVALLPGVSTSRELSKPVPDAFSVKLQRKLASTVPPRPVVTITFEAAYKHLERLCQDGWALTEVLNYYDSHSLMVGIELFIGAFFSC